MKDYIAKKEHEKYKKETLLIDMLDDTDLHGSEAVKELNQEINVLKKQISTAKAIQAYEWKNNIPTQSKE